MMMYCAGLSKDDIENEMHRMNEDLNKIKE